MFTIYTVFAGIVSALFIVIFFQRKNWNVLHQDWLKLKQDFENFTKEHAALVSADLYFSRQLKALNAQIVSLDGQLQSVLTTRQNDGGYQHALKILEMGGDKQEILESCHLSNAEAELLMNLQAYRAALK